MSSADATKDLVKFFKKDPSKSQSQTPAMTQNKSQPEVKVNSKIWVRAQAQTQKPPQSLEQNMQMKAEQVHSPSLTQNNGMLVPLQRSSPHQRLSPSRQLASPLQMLSPSQQRQFPTNLQEPRLRPSRRQFRGNYSGRVMNEPILMRRKSVQREMPLPRNGTMSMLSDQGSQERFSSVSGKTERFLPPQDPSECLTPRIPLGAHSLVRRIPKQTGRPRQIFTQGPARWQANFQLSQQKNFSGTPARKLKIIKGKDAPCWHCSLGCGKSYQKSSSRSIQKHRVVCFKRFINIPAHHLRLFGDDLRTSVYATMAREAKNQESKGILDDDGSLFLRTMLVHYFCVGTFTGEIITSYASPVCSVPEDYLEHQCHQILLHAGSCETDRVQMMATNSEIVFHYRTGRCRDGILIYVAAVPSDYRGDPINQVISDFARIYKEKEEEFIQTHGSMETIPSRHGVGFAAQAELAARASIASRGGLTTRAGLGIRSSVKLNNIQEDLALRKTQAFREKLSEGCGPRYPPVTQDRSVHPQEMLRVQRRYEDNSVRNCNRFVQDVDLIRGTSWEKEEEEASMRFAVNSARERYHRRTTSLPLHIESSTSPSNPEALGSKRIRNGFGEEEYLTIQAHRGEAHPGKMWHQFAEQRNIKFPQISGNFEQKPSVKRQRQETPPTVLTYTLPNLESEKSTESILRV